MRKILIIQTAFIGDVILATPLIEQLYRHFPEATIDFLLRKGNESLLDNHPYLNQVLIWNKKQQKHKQLFTLLRQIRQEKYDLVLNLQRFLATGLLTAFSGATHRIGFNKNPLSIFFTKKIKHHIGSKTNSQHEVERNLSLIHHLCNNVFVKPKLYPSAADFKKVTTNTPYICIAPTSVWFTKQFPANKWIELIDQLDPIYSIFLLGGPADRKACEAIKIASKHPNIINKAGNLSFLASAALMKNAKMNYVNDSAPLHMASAMNAPVMAVFCSTIPAFGFTPLSDQHQIIETKSDLPCRPCGLHGHSACPKGHFKCATSIAIKDLIFLTKR